MGVAGEATFSVALDPLVAAIKAVEPHALRGRTGDDVLQRIRFVAGRDLLHVVATNGTTAAVAVVPIDPDSDSRGPRVAEDDGTFTLDADPSEVRQIVARFTKGASSRKDAPRRTLRMHWTDRVLKLTDATEQLGTLELDREDVKSPDLDEVPAKGLDVLVSPPSGDYPPVLDDVRKALAAVGESAESKPLVTQPGTLALFASPLGSAAPKADVDVQATGSSAARGFVVTCGSWFAGVLPSRFADDDSLARRSRARLLLLHRLLGRPMPDDVDDAAADEDEIPPQTDDDGYQPTGDDDEQDDDEREIENLELPDIPPIPAVRTAPFYATDYEGQQVPVEVQDERDAALMRRTLTFERFLLEPVDAVAMTAPAPPDPGVHEARDERRLAGLVDRLMTGTVKAAPPPPYPPT